MYRTVWVTYSEFDQSDYDWLVKHCESVEVQKLKTEELHYNGVINKFVVQYAALRFATNDPKIEMLIPFRFPDAYIEYKEAVYDETDTIYRGL